MVLLLIPAILSVLMSPAAAGADGFVEHQAGGDARLRYRVLAPAATAPEGGFRLVVFLPGGDGSDAFTGWCQAIYRNAIPDGFLAVQLVAPEWRDGQGSPVTWPTRLSPTEGMEVPVEKFFEMVVAEVAGRHPLQDGEIYTFSWSSGGVPAYLIAADGRGGVRGSFVAMAVFRERWVPDDLAPVARQRFFLYQSPDDEVTPLASAETARITLEREGAAVRLETYEGGHGWRLGAAHFPDIREGFSWLVQGERRE